MFREKGSPILCFHEMSIAKQACRTRCPRANRDCHRGGHRDFSEVNLRGSSVGVWRFILIFLTSSSFLSEIILVTMFISILDSNFYKLHVNVWCFSKYSLSVKKFLYLTTSAFGILRYNSQRWGDSEAFTAAIFFEKSLIDFESQFSISNICFML